MPALSSLPKYTGIRGCRGDDGGDGGSGGGPAPSNRRSRSPRPLRRRAPPYCGVSPAGRAGAERSRQPPSPLTPAADESRAGAPRAAVLTREGRGEEELPPLLPPPLTGEVRPRPAVYGERPPPAARRPLSRERRARHRRRASPWPLGAGGPRGGRGGRDVVSPEAGQAPEREGRASSQKKKEMLSTGAGRGWVESSPEERDPGVS